MTNRRLFWWMAALLLVGSLYIIAYFMLLTSGTEKDRTLMIILKSNSAQSDFWQTVRSGAEEAARENDVRYTVTGPLDDQEVNVQLNALQEAIQTKPSAVIIAPLADQRVLTAIRRVMDAGVPVIVMDTPLYGPEAPISVASDHLQMGEQAGRMASYQTSGIPHTVVLGDYRSSAILQARMTGIHNILDSVPGSVTELYYCGESEQLAYVMMNKLLQQEPQLNAVIAANDVIAVGAARALKEHPQHKVNLVAFDSSFYEIQLLEERTIHALIVPKPFNIGYLAVQRALKHDESNSSHERLTLIPSTVITPSDMYAPENQKLLFPFDEK
ncbi:substrate-binding domain-containing protein [Paenibacillus kandeliae]|uniref:substrate-binding domain-containing protein n=1 Tax=Paenibacillus kandeliae TaxID=3231269 RepID=UPI00345B437E